MFLPRVSRGLEFEEIGVISKADHYADWEWVCVYTNTWKGVDVKGDGDDPSTTVGDIWKLHYHHHGVKPDKCSDYCGCWNDVSFTRGDPEGEWNENNKCKISGKEYHIDNCYIWVEKEEIPESPKVFVGEDVHGFWDGYPEVPRDACSAPTFAEAVDTQGAPLTDGTTSHVFNRLHSITLSSGYYPYDASVHLYGGKWGHEDDSPFGPFGPEGDRDVDGRYDDK